MTVVGSCAKNDWGQFLAPTVDPEADTVITQEQLEGFELNDDIYKIPAQLWGRWINLCIDMVKKGTGDLEVSCRLLRKAEDASIYRILVPVQKVSGVSVRVDTFDSAVDIETGETVTQWPPEGWIPCGSSHSHNTMGAFFSGTDDKYELGDPGLHIVVGRINADTGDHELCASVTANMRRFELDPFNFVDKEPNLSQRYHPKCLDVITVPLPLTGTTKPKTYTTYSSHHSTSQWESTNVFLSATPTNEFVTEVNAVRNAVDGLLAAADRQGKSPTRILYDLATEIEDLAMMESNPLDDPFYWSTNAF